MFCVEDINKGHLMRKIFLSIALLFTCSVSFVHAQFNWCPTCVVYANVDWATHDTIAGWGFECTSGGAVDRVDVWYRGDDGQFYPVPPPVGYTLLVNATYGVSIQRPDVHDAYAGACPNVTQDEGYQQYLATPIPAGPRDIWVVSWRGPLYTTQQFHLSQ
jgi:hypothetical protein